MAVLDRTNNWGNYSGGCLSLVRARIDCQINRFKAPGDFAQADCFAGIWAHHANSARQLLEAGDIEEGLTAASAIGDDTLQKQSQGYIRPDSFTHGSSAQRVKWFKIGLAGGDMDDCDTFALF